MRTSLVALVWLLVFILAGCETGRERMIKLMEKQIQETVEIDWHSGIPLDGLVDAGKMCKEHPDLEDCDTVQAQLLDIAITLDSCRQNQRSRLCQAVVEIIGTHPISSTLPKAKAIQLPDTPFYWSLPTAVLEAQAGNFGYREEVASWWWESWRTIILSCFALLSAGYASWFGWSIWRKAKQKRARLLAIRRAERIEQEKIRLAQQEQARIEAERQAKQEREAAIAERKYLEAKKAAEQQAADAAAKLIAEQAEAALLLKAVFNSPKTKRGNHDNSLE